MKNKLKSLIQIISRKMISQNDQAKGLLLTAIGVLAIVPDSILIRLIQADILTITFWRALIPGILISITVLSSVVFPSVSSPSSEVSETLPLCPGLLATTLTVLLTNPV